MSEKAMLKHDAEKSFIFNFTSLEANRKGFTLSFDDAAKGCFSVYSVKSTGERRCFIVYFINTR